MCAVKLIPFKGTFRSDFISEEQEREENPRSTRRWSGDFCMAMSQSSGLPETLATAYNPGMCFLALPVITLRKDRAVLQRMCKDAVSGKSCFCLDI